METAEVKRCPGCGGIGFHMLGCSHYKPGQMIMTPWAMSPQECAWMSRLPHDSELAALRSRVKELEEQLYLANVDCWSLEAENTRLREGLGDTLAKAIYEACRQEARDSDRPIVPEPWAKRDEAFRTQFVSTIERICQPGYETTPEREHESWMRAYEEMGWRYGEERDPVAKTHPDMVPFADLPESERQKDAIFLACCLVGRAARSLLEDSHEG